MVTCLAVPPVTLATTVAFQFLPHSLPRFATVVVTPSGLTVALGTCGGGTGWLLDDGGNDGGADDVNDGETVVETVVVGDGEPLDDAAGPEDVLDSDGPTPGLSRSPPGTAASPIACG